MKALYRKIIEAFRRWLRGQESHADHEQEARELAELLTKMEAQAQSRISPDLNRRLTKARLASEGQA